MEDILKLIAEKLQAEGKIIRVKNNSLFHAMSIDPSTMDTFVNNLAIAVANDLNLYKNKLLPTLKEYSEAVKTKIDSLDLNTGLSEYVVEEIRIPEFVLSLKDKGKLLPIKEERILGISTLNIPYPGDKIKEYSKLENPVDDKMVQNIFRKYSNAELEDIWNKYLVNISSSNNNIDKLYLDPLLNIEKIVMVYVWLENIRKNPVNGIKVSEVKLMEITSNYMVDLLNMFAIAIKSYNDIDVVNRLVYNTIDKKVFVHSGVYDRFLSSSDDNTVEALLGYIVSGNKNYTDTLLDRFITNVDAYKELWEKTTKQLTIASANDKVKTYKVVYSIELEKFINDLSDDMLEYTEEIVFKDVNDKLIKYLDTLSVDTLFNVDYVAKEVISKFVFTNSNFGKFLDNMYQYIAENNTLTSEEAAGLAVVDLVLDYLLNQIEFITE